MFFDTMYNIFAFSLEILSDLFEFFLDKQVRLTEKSATGLYVTCPVADTASGVKRIFGFCSDPCQNKNIIDRSDSFFEITVLNADDDIQLTGTLIDHLYVNICMCQC